MASKKLLVIQAQKQISRLLLTIQAEKEKYEPGEWDKLFPGRRAADGRFGSGGGGSKPSSSSSSSSSTVAPTSSTGASSPGKIGAAVKVAQESLSDLEQRLTQISSDGIAQAKELWNSPEVQQIYEETKAKLEELSKGFGEAYDKTVKATGVDPKKIADAAKKGLDKIQGKTPDEKRSMADLAQLSLAGIETVGAITAGAFLVMGAKKLKPLKQMVREHRVVGMLDKIKKAGGDIKKSTKLPPQKGESAIGRMEEAVKSRNQIALSAAKAALFTAATETLRQIHKGSVEKGMEEGKVSGEMKSYKDLMTNAFSIIEGGAKTVQDMFESEE